MSSLNKGLDDQNFSLDGPKDQACIPWWLGQLWIGSVASLMKRLLDFRPSSQRKWLYPRRRKLNEEKSRSYRQWDGFMGRRMVSN